MLLDDEDHCTTGQTDWLPELAPASAPVSSRHTDQATRSRAEVSSPLTLIQTRVYSLVPPRMWTLIMSYTPERMDSVVPTETDALPWITSQPDGRAIGAHASAVLATSAPRSRSNRIIPEWAPSAGYSELSATGSTTPAATAAGGTEVH